MSGLGAKLICRADVAVLLSVTVRQVARNEARLGIRPYKVFLNARTVRYHCIETLNVLRQRGLIR